MINTGIIFGILAGLVHITAYIFYYKSILKGSTKPNNTSWVIWIFLGLLNSSSYLTMSNDLVKSILPISSAILRCITLGLIILKGRWRKLDEIEYSILSIGIASGFTWYIFKSAANANLILQFAYIISIIPTYRSIITGKGCEDLTPWFLWSLGYCLGVATVIARWKGQFQELAFSTIGIILHLITVYLIIRYGRKKSTISS